MANGIVSRDVADDIGAIDGLEPSEGCQHIVEALGRGAKRGMRLGESACKVAKQNRIMLAILLILTVKADVAFLIGKIVALLK